MLAASSCRTIGIEVVFVPEDIAVGGALVRRLRGRDSLVVATTASNGASGGTGGGAAVVALLLLLAAVALRRRSVTAT